MVCSSLSAMVAEAKLDVISVQGLTEKMATDAGTAWNPSNRPA